MAANPREFVERPRPAAHKQNQARSISRAQATALLAAVRERSALHELLVCLLFLNGLRATEAVAADLEDLGERDGHRVLRVRGKGETEKNLGVPPNAPTGRRARALAARARAHRGRRARRGTVAGLADHRPAADAPGDLRVDRAAGQRRNLTPEYETHWDDEHVRAIIAQWARWHTRHANEEPSAASYRRWAARQPAPVPSATSIRRRFGGSWNAARGSPPASRPRAAGAAGGHAATRSDRSY
jgi:integrase